MALNSKQAASYMTVDYVSKVDEEHRFIGAVTIACTLLYRVAIAGHGSRNTSATCRKDEEEEIMKKKKKKQNEEWTDAENG